MTAESSTVKKRPSWRVNIGTKEGAAQLPIYGVAVMLVMKAIAAWVTGSMSIRADAFHSLIDLISAIIGFIAIKIAMRPADKDHQYGHSKAEALAGFIIGGLIIYVAITIIYEAVQRLLHPEPLSMIAVGIWVTAAAITINIAISLWVIRVARKTDSVALLAEGKHLWADVLSSAAVLIGLVLVNILPPRFVFLNIAVEAVYFDAIVAIIIGVIIAKEAIEPLKTSLDNIMDRKLPEEEQAIIENTIAEFSHQVTGLANLRTRKAGSQRFIDLSFTMPRNVSVADAHQVCHLISHRISEKLNSTVVTSHIIPCTSEDRKRRPADCTHCQVDCTLRLKRPGEQAAVEESKKQPESPR
ncbi:MAG: cation transporter [Dehalococcoidia bacterium]|nr:MAG: cation transporter [Dehalococcoidia bacterium]